jgi:rare lipoprotein A (peptidoglycan hydrolase)
MVQRAIEAGCGSGRVKRSRQGCRRRRLVEAALVGAAVAIGMFTAPEAAMADPASADAPQQVGLASYYGTAHHGRRTASGSIFDMNEMTAAHAWLPFGTRLRVTLEDTGRQVVVVVTDRLRSARSVIDLSFGAARELGMLQRGMARVTLAAE